MITITVTQQEARQLDKAIRLLRDRHYRNHANAKTSETAQEQYRIYQELDKLRGRLNK